MSYRGQKIAAIIQARMQSSRLPGKVLMDIGGTPMLGWMLRRASLADTVDKVLVATTDSSQDDAVAEYCETQKIDYTRGSQSDVLDRYYRAAQSIAADWIVRLTADCPLLDPDLLDRTVRAAWLGEDEAQFDFTANRLPPPWGRTYPIGLDVEVFSFFALEAAWRHAFEKHQREHVTPYFYETAEVEDAAPVPGWGRRWQAPGRGFELLLVEHPEDYGEIRWTVDTPQDLQLVRELVRRLPDARDFNWLDILDIYLADEALQQTNSMIVHKTHRDIDDRS